jgi:hypothetical protein
MKEAYPVRRTVPPSAEIQASIDKLLSKRLVDDPQKMLSELPRLGARLIIQGALEDEFDQWLGRARYEGRPDGPPGKRRSRSLRISTLSTVAAPSSDRGIGERCDLPDVFCVVTAELGDVAADGRRAERGDQGLGGTECVGGEGDVVLLPDKGDEVEVQRGGGRTDAEARVGDAGGDRESYLEVRLALGSSHRVGWYAGVAEHTVEQDARARAEFAFGDAHVS